MYKQEKLATLGTKDEHKQNKTQHNMCWKSVDIKIKPKCSLKEMIFLIKIKFRNVVITMRSFAHARLTTGFVTGVTRRLPKNCSTFRSFCEARWVQSLMFCVLLCISLFVPLSLLSWALYILISTLLLFKSRYNLNRIKHILVMDVFFYNALTVIPYHWR
jgi:hypothetical protein